MGIVVSGPLLTQGSVCESILRSLPAWFGIEQAIAEYIEAVQVQPTFLALLDGQVAGFLTLKQHNEYSAEILVMGVRPEAHRRGVGSALIHRAEELLREGGTEYLQVKTLGPSRPDEHYAATRAFYAAMGFRPLEEMLSLWDSENPCLIMVKSLHREFRTA